MTLCNVHSLKYMTKIKMTTIMNGKVSSGGGRGGEKEGQKEKESGEEDG